MKQIQIWVKLFTIVLLFSCLALKVDVTPSLAGLICEYKTNPVGIDVQKPRLSWQIVTTENSFTQSAYEIKVTNQSAKGKVIWNSGKVISGQSVNLEYQGPELQPMQRVYWQVRIWDNKNKETKWSEPAYWEMGILKPELWTASWITLANEKVFDGSKPAHYLRKEFSTSKKIKSAKVYVSSLGLYQLFINGKKVGNDLFTPGWTSYNKRLQYLTYDFTPMLKSKNSI